MAMLTFDSTDLRLVSPLLLDRGDRRAEATEEEAAREVWTGLMDQLGRMRMLGSDWDGQGAEAPAGKIVDWVIDWVRQMRGFHHAIPPSRAVPGVAGEIYLEWQGNSFYMSAEITSPGRIEWTLTLPEQPNRHWATEGEVPYFLSPVR